VRPKCRVREAPRTQCLDSPAALSGWPALAPGTWLNACKITPEHLSSPRQAEGLQRLSDLGLARTQHLQRASAAPSTYIQLLRPRPPPPRRRAQRVQRLSVRGGSEPPALHRILRTQNSNPLAPSTYIQRASAAPGTWITGAAPAVPKACTARANFGGGGAAPPPAPTHPPPPPIGGGGGGVPERLHSMGTSSRTKCQDRLMSGLARARIQHLQRASAAPST
jgi:hypothetical protein